MLRALRRSRRGAAHWLALAAAPTFALMGLVTGLQQGQGGPVICGGSGVQGGMVTMYLLMSAFHLGPWLRPSSYRKLSSH